MEKINGRTPEEIKKGLQCCFAPYLCYGECPYYYDKGYIGDCTTELAKNALAYIQHLEAQQPKWISVKDRLPEEDDVVVAWLEINAGLILVYHDGAFYDLAFDKPTMIVTHWMPLPEPPKEDAHE
jgi:hypothetical protein